MKLDNYSKYAPAVLRTGIAIVLLWFGFTQLKNPAQWTRLVPDFITSMMSATSFVYFNGLFEIALAILLLLGLFTRVTAFIVTLHLLSITINLGYGPTAARDFALTMAALAIFLHGADELCLDKNLDKKAVKELIKKKVKPVKKTEVKETTISENQA